MNGTARVGRAEDYGFGVADELMANAADIDVPLTEGDVPQDIAIFAPSLAHRVGFQDWWGRAARRGASPATATAFNLVTFSADLRSCLPDIRCPTLVIARTESFGELSEHGRYLAEHIAGARFVTFPGLDLLPWAGEFDSIVDEIEEFATGTRAAHVPTRLLSTVLFTDIVDSTVRAAEAGDRQMARACSTSSTSTWTGCSRATTGSWSRRPETAILARFAAPAQAVRCAAVMVAGRRRPGTCQLRAGSARRRDGAPRRRHRRPGRPHCVAGERDGGGPVKWS